MAVEREPSFERHSRHWRPRIVLPIILIGLGIVLLGQNLGLINSGVWTSMWRFWPILLVLVGIEIILGHSGWWGGAISVVIVLVVVGALSAMVFWGLGPVGVNRVGTTGVTTIEHMAEDVGFARQATISLSHNAGHLIVSSLPEDTNRLIEADLGHLENTQVYKSIKRTNDVTEISLRDPAQVSIPFVFMGRDDGDDWNVKLARDIPLDLIVETGASELNLDLREVQVRSLTIESGASSATIVLPRAAGTTNAHVESGAASLDVTVPSEVAARIKITGALSSATIDEGRFPRVGSYYQSSDYDTATNRVDLDVENAVSSVNIH